MQRNIHLLPIIHSHTHRPVSGGSGLLLPPPLLCTCMRYIKSKNYTATGSGLLVDRAPELRHHTDGVHNYSEAWLDSAKSRVTRRTEAEHSSLSMFWLENAPILVLTLDRDRSQWIGSPVKIGHRSSANSPFRPIVCLARPQHTATGGTKQWSHSAATYYVTYQGPRPRPFHTCSGQRVGVFQHEVLQCRQSAVSPPEIEQWTPVADQD